MKFHSLKIANFGSIKEIELPLSGQGLTLLLGRNEDAPKADSNGSGKSLPLDAFAWALWGSTIRGFSTDEVIHRQVNKDCKVQVFFEDKGHSYEVRRYRRNKEDKHFKTNDLVLFCDGKDVSGGSVASTEESIETILGLDFHTFCAMMPGAGVTVASMTDSEIKSLLERLLRTEALSKASEEARRRSKVVFSSLLTEQTSLRDLERSIKDLKERITTLAAQEANHASAVKAKLLELNDAISTLNKEISALSAAVAYEPILEARLATIRAEATAKSARIKDYDSTMRDLATDCKNKVDQENIYISLAEETWQSSVESLSTIESSENTCPTCSQDVGDVELDAMRSYQEAKQADIASHKAKIKEINTASIRDIGIVSKARDEDAESLRKDYKIIEELEDDISSIATSKTSLILKRNSLELLEKSKHDYKFSENPYSSLIENDKVKLHTSEYEKEEKEKNISDLQKKSDILSFWVDSFSPSGIRSFMLDHIVPILDHHAKAYSDIITDGEMEVTFHTKNTLKSGKVSEKFNIKVSQKSGGSSYVSNSTGERARANLIIALALGELASLRAEKSIPFRFLDEPFESIDESGIEAVVNLLNKQKDKYDTVYVVTHQDSLMQMFQNKKTIVKKDGYSEMEK